MQGLCLVVHVVAFDWCMLDCVYACMFEYSVHACMHVCVHGVCMVCLCSGRYRSLTGRGGGGGGKGGRIIAFPVVVLNVRWTVIVGLFVC